MINVRESSSFNKNSVPIFALVYNKGKCILLLQSTNHTEIAGKNVRFLSEPLYTYANLLRLKTNQIKFVLVNV